MRSDEGTPSLSSWLSLYLLAMLLVSGCGSSESLVESGTLPAKQLDSPESVTPAAVEERVLELFADWEHTPYRWGGTNRRGIDCSAYVKQVYADAFGIQIPRTTLQQVGIGDPVKKQDLVPGDLVFFLPNNKRSRHVGIYLSDGTFTHASTSEGVTTSNLDEPYWRDAYWTARRIVSPASSLAETKKDSEIPDLPTLIQSDKKKRKRTGW